MKEISTTKRKVPERGTPERKEYDRIKKAESRDRQKKKKKEDFHAAVQRGIEERTFEQADEVVDNLNENQKEVLASFVSGIKQAIQNELGGEELTSYGKNNEHYIIEAMAGSSFGIKHNLIQRMSHPHGVVVCAMWYPDAACSEVIEFVRTRPRLVGSQTFLDLYRQTLKEVLEFFSGKNKGFADPPFIEEIRREAA
jgi:hypothetical protein